MRTQAEELLSVLQKNYLNIMRINLVEDTYENMEDDTEWSSIPGQHFTTTMNLFFDKGYVYEYDLADLREFARPERLLEVFSDRRDPIYHDYRRKIGDEFRWVTMKVLPVNDYSQENPVVFAFIWDSNDEYKEKMERQVEMEGKLYLDPLTGLLNRLAYNIICTNYEENLEKHPVGVISCDVNGLKYVNDNYGHKRGDEYLKVFADKLKELFGLRHVFRISGDEFVVVFERFTKDHFTTEYEKLREFLKSQPSPMASIGTAWLDAPKNIEKVARFAEKAMYADKQEYYHVYHGIEKEIETQTAEKYFDVEQVLRERQTIENEGDGLDKSGLSSRLFDVFAQTNQKGYLFLTNLQTNVTRMSPSIVQDFDLPGEYMTNAIDLWGELIHPDDRQKMQDAFEEIVSGKVERNEVSYRVRNRRDEYVMITGESALIRGEGDEPDYFSGTIINNRKQGEIDPVSNMPNSRAFMKRLIPMTELEETNTCMCIMIDLFSSFNLMYGYPFGARLIRRFGEELQTLVGDLGEVYHTGDAMFHICCDSLDKESTISLYEKIRKRANEGFEIQGKYVTVKTLGSAYVFDYARGLAEHITSNLGFAIAYSKSTRHGDVVFCNVKNHKHEFNNREMIGLIYQQILTDFTGFTLHYQPVVDAKTGRIGGAEALVRWYHPEYGLVPPMSFIGFIEQNPCIFELGNWVLRRAMTDAMEIKKYIPNFVVNVNIASPQLERREFRGELEKALRETGYPPQDLCLELTERCRELDFDFLRGEIEYFKSLGIRVAMDDFGTGNASLQVVLELPMDEIKIDRAFVIDIQNKSKNQVLVEAIVSGAKVTQSEICIEGIEDAEMAEYLQRYEPNYYQGYHYSKPLDKDAFLSLISNG